MKDPDGIDGDKARRRREELRLKQETVAHEVRVSQGQLSKYEKEKREPSVPQGVRWARALKCRLIDLLRRSPDNPV